MADLTNLREIERGQSRRFTDDLHVLSFDDYFLQVCNAPKHQLRTAPQYLRDCIDSFGSRDVVTPFGSRRRYSIFDGAFGGEREGVIGHEAAQEALNRLLQHFISEGRVTRMILLHGPNGSAKSSFIRCLARGLEHYSTSDEGALYRFNWVFPKKRIGRKKLGFATAQAIEAISSYARLEDDEVDARLPADLRDHPLLLLPTEPRRRLLKQLQEQGKLTGREPVGQYLLNGDLSPRSRSIFDALLNAYTGDMQRVLQHVQIERFTFSRRYRRGIVTVEPQLHVDAGIRQVTADHALQSLPPSLRNLSMYEPFGDLVDANRGFINFNDLLKKPLDAFKYLLATSEKASVSLPQATLHLDLVLLASSNDIHLDAFKEYSDFASFKGRLDLIKMPYLRNYTKERRIYDQQVEQGGFGEYVMPHATEVLAQWAILTRLSRCNAEVYPAASRKLIADLSPWHKAQLYAHGHSPPELTADQARDLQSLASEILSEGQDRHDYEGGSGASPRELKQVLLNALQDPLYWGLSPLAVINQLRSHIKNTSMYGYLQRKVDGGYHDHSSFIDQVESHWLDRFDTELRDAMGLVNERQYDDLFARYILHVSYSLKGEKVYNETTGKSEDPDIQLLQRLETVWSPSGNIVRFREDLVARVGGWHVEFEGSPANYRRLFPKLFSGLETAYHEQQKDKVGRMCRHIALLLEDGQPSSLSPDNALQTTEHQRATAVIEDLCGPRFGYRRPALRQALSALMRARY